MESGTQPERDDKVSLELSEEILNSMEVGMSFRDYSGRISSMDFHKSVSYLVTASDDESIRLYDVNGGTCLKTINSKKYGVDLVRFTSHPTTVIYSSKNGWDESLRLLSLHDNKYLRYFKGHHDRVVSLSLCAGKECFISGSLDRTVLLWDQRAEKCQGLLRVQGRPATAYDEQGQIFAIAFGGYIRMFDARKYEKGPFNIFSVGGDVSDANVVEFSNDGRLMLLTTMGGHIHVLDSFRGTLLSTYNVKPVSSNSTLEASFSPEGMFVVSGSGDGSVHAWSVRSGKEVTSWPGCENEPPLIKWAPGRSKILNVQHPCNFKHEAVKRLCCATCVQRYFSIAGSASVSWSCIPFGCKMACERSRAELSMLMCTQTDHTVGIALGIISDLLWLNLFW
ncbi:hypothetical protein LWI29_033527 [Acer saccharum]|uniref:Uncharacterized protein n=1 Tax=Acer saccharum TaxID=4024 RepID=A0AA39VLW6_ACESA|nr:hypothetical protein LWI29_033527 [Acer saccharum]